MLRLEKLRLAGFKSFSDKTEVHIPTGITAVVGPNGCGKSNIGDAINWVLGEQSAKMLRGQQMADVIFSGSAARKPMGMAEVSLVFAGTTGLPLDDQGRVVVTRRLFRSGESEYLVNGARSRLKDIQEMLREGHVGARTYATIEQGKIDQVLNAKPRDRRALIEDAAGISGYRHKRRLAELKLEATHANLLRVNDIVVEVRRQINSLKRQAARARRYRRLRDELREKELTRFALQAQEMERRLAELREAESRARDAEAEAAAAFSRLEVELDAWRRGLERSQHDLRETSERLHQRELEIDRAEATIRSCRERSDEAEASARTLAAEIEAVAARRTEAAARHGEHQANVERETLALDCVSAELAERQATLREVESSQRGLRAELEEARARQFEAQAQATDRRNRLRSTHETLERLDAQRARLEVERGEIDGEGSRMQLAAAEQAAEAERQARSVAQQRERHLAAEGALREARDAHTADVETVAEARARLAAARERLAEIEDLEARFAGASDGVRTLLAHGAPDGIRLHGVVADYVEASRRAEAAAEVYLQALLPTVIVEEDVDACRAATLLRRREAGRTLLLSRTQPAGALAVGAATGNGHGAVPAELLSDGRVLGRLRDEIRLKSSLNGVLQERIGDALLVDTLETALDLHRRYPTQDYVTSDGEVVRASGVTEVGGRQAEDRGLLAHKRRVAELGEEASRAEARALELIDRTERARERVVDLELELRDRRLGLELAERRLLETELRVERSTEARERSERRAEVLLDEIAALAAEIEAVRQSRDELDEDVRRFEAEQLGCERALAHARERLEQIESELRERTEQVTELRTAQAAQRERREALEEQGRRIGAELDELEARQARLATELSVARQRAAEGRELQVSTEAALVDLLAGRESLGGEVRQLETMIASAAQALDEGEARRREGQTSLRQLQAATHEAELDRTRAESARQHLDELCRQELGLDAGAARAPEDAAAVDLEALAREVEELKARIEAIGPVNMTAIEEFSALEERHGFLTAQKTDLEQSTESLRETIRRIDRQSRQRFTEAFEQIRASYQEVFRLLFSGGRADLRLEEGEDVLECGIDILAQPPGKRLTGVHLLSGGEKALSAIALLFAIFRYQPSPFCLLDEVDAALDDVNVGRFARMVREYAEQTQFIIITHNKLSMEAASLLYGVTMEEPGVSKVVSLQLQ